MFTRYLIVRPDIPWIQGTFPLPIHPRRSSSWRAASVRRPSYSTTGSSTSPQTCSRYRRQPGRVAIPFLIEMLEGLTPIATIPQSRPLLPHSHRAA